MKAVGEVAGVGAHAIEFEARRLAWFAAQGFEGQGRRLEGCLGETCVVTGGEYRAVRAL
jgi:hypothetical protein